MNFKFISQNFGPINFIEDRAINKKLPDFWTSYTATGEFGSIKVQSHGNSMVQASLVQAVATENDLMLFTTSPIHKHMLIFVFRNSLFIHFTSSKRKLFHDRSCNLITETKGSLRLNFQKDHDYLIILLCFTQQFLLQYTETFTNPQFVQGIYTAFFHSKSVIATKEAMDLLSIMFFDELDKSSDAFLMEEISRSILTWITEPNPFRLFQPNNLSLEEAELLYTEKNDLLHQKHKNIPYHDLLRLAGIVDLYNFRRRLKQLYGLNIRDFLTEGRLADAVTLLKAGNLSIKEIAFKTGFVNAAYFSRVFTNYFGISPKHFQHIS